MSGRPSLKIWRRGSMSHQASPKAVREGNWHWRDNYEVWFATRNAQSRKSAERKFDALFGGSSDSSESGTNTKEFTSPRFAGTTKLKCHFEMKQYKSTAAPSTEEKVDYLIKSCSRSSFLTTTSILDHEDGDDIEVNISSPDLQFVTTKRPKYCYRPRRDKTQHFLEIVEEKEEVEEEEEEDKGEEEKELEEKRLTNQQKVFLICGQREPLRISDAYPEKFLNDCKKIAEGSYGEVFMYTSPKKNGPQIIIKLIPVNRDDFDMQCLQLLAEVSITLSLHGLRTDYSHLFTDTFCAINKIKVLKGKYPEKLIKLWEEFDKIKESYNVCPDRYDDEQIYLSIEMLNGGTPIESAKFSNAAQTYYLFIQVVFALAVAEAAFQFEHRDLHNGNILIKLTKKKLVKYKLNNKTYAIPTYLRKVTIIDFTLSRKTEQDGVVLYNDLEEDEDIFGGEGDIQFDVYRDMRELVDKKWDVFEPKSNIFWLRHLAEKLKSFKYGKEKTKLHKKYIQKVQNFSTNVVNFKSALDLAESFTEFISA